MVVLLEQGQWSKISLLPLLVPLPPSLTPPPPPSPRRVRESWLSPWGGEGGLGQPHSSVIYDFKLAFVPIQGESSTLPLLERVSPTKALWLPWGLNKCTSQALVGRSDPSMVCCLCFLFYCENSESFSPLASNSSWGCYGLQVHTRPSRTNWLVSWSNHPEGRIYQVL